MASECWACHCAPKLRCCTAGIARCTGRCPLRPEPVREPTSAATPPGRDERKRDALGRLFERLRASLERTGALPPLAQPAAPAQPSAAPAPAAAAAPAHEPAQPPAQSDPERGSGGGAAAGDPEQAAAPPDQAQPAAPDEAQAAAAGQPARESLAELLSQPLPYACEAAAKGRGKGEAKGKGEDPGGAGSDECDNPLVWTLLYLAQHYDRLGRTGAPSAS